MNNARTFSLIGFLPYGSKLEGFCLPVFELYGSKSYFIQFADNHNSRAEFRIFDCDFISLLPCKRMDVIEGGPVIVCFVDHREEVRFGTVRELEPTLRHYLSETSARPGTCLQIAELIGSTHERRDAVRTVGQALARRIDFETASKFIQTSVAYDVLWRQLTAALISDASIKSLAALRFLIARSFAFAEDELLPLSLWAKIEPLLTVERGKIIAETRAEIPSIAGWAASAEVTSSSVEQTTRHLPNQEARVTAMLRVAFDARAAHQSPPKLLPAARFKFERSAARFIEATYSHSLFFCTDDETLAYFAFARLYRLCPHDRRVILLEKAADNLGDISMIGKFIRDCIFKSKSRKMKRRATAIDNLLRQLKTMLQ